MFFNEKRSAAIAKIVDKKFEKILAVEFSEKPTCIHKSNKTTTKFFIIKGYLTIFIGQMSH